MRVPQLTTCCCGCTLESGSLIIGWLDLIGGVLLTSLAIFTLFTGSVDPEVSGDSLPYTIVMTINGILTIVISVCLIVGVNKRSHKLVRYWVILATISIVLSFSGGMLNVVLLMIQGYIGTALTTCLAYLLCSALYAYLICVVHSLYREILAEVQPSVA